MLEMTDYIVVSSESQDILSERVLRKAKQGYKLAGGVTPVIFPGARYVEFFQAMYKEEAIADDSF